MFIYLWAAGSAAFLDASLGANDRKAIKREVFQKHPAVPDASGKTFRKSVRSSINLLQPSPGVRCAGLIGGTVLVAAGVFLDQKKRREQM